MKALLIYCKEGFNGFLPLGIAYIAAFLKKNGHTVECIDTSIYKTQEEIHNALDEKEFDVYGLSVMTPYFDLGMTLSQYIRRKYPLAKIVWGGPHATVCPEEVLASGNVDYVIIGEGENTFNEILNKLDKIYNIPGIAYLNDSRKMVINPQRNHIENLDNLPFPDRSLFEVKKYIKFSNKNKLHLLFSRGCPFSCTFCQPTLNQIFGKKVRYRSPENVIDEIKYLIDQYGVYNFSFNDDTLTLNKRLFVKFCKLLLESDMRIQWEFNTRANTIDKEMMIVAAKSGAKAIYVGIESGNGYIREKIYKKGIRREQIISVFKWAKEINISASAYFMVGAPNETISMVGDTVRLINRIMPQEMQLSKTVPLPGTYLYDMFEKMGLLKYEKKHSRYIYTKTPVTWKTNTLTNEQKNWLYKAILLEYASSLKDAFLNRRFFKFLYLLLRIILPFELANLFALFCRKLWSKFVDMFVSTRALHT